MEAAPDYRIRALGRNLLTLRRDLNFTPSSAEGKTYFRIEDPVRGKFYRIGLREYTFISLLDGRTPVSEALRLTAASGAGRALSEDDAAAICRWLVDAELASTADSAGADRLAQDAEAAESRQQMGRLNPLVIRLPLFYPDRLFARLLPLLGWLHHRWTMLGWAVLLLLASAQLVAEWDRFVASSRGILAPHNWLSLAVCWLVLKVVHETSHGLVCKKYGGHVREAGMMLVLFTPIAYVDVTSSWRFRSHWHRIHTALAGMYAEAAIAALATLVWSSSGSGLLQNLCYNVVVMAGLTTILFNANPLMKFDGYYVLSDWLQLANLYDRGQQFVRYLGRRYLLGLPIGSPVRAGARGHWIRAYGVASFMWRIVVCVGLAVTASTLFRGAGVVLTAAAVLMWIGVPAARLAQYLWRGKDGEVPDRIRFAWTVSLAVALILLLFVVPWPGARRAPAVVDFDPLTVVRAEAPGFVRELHVRSGQRVVEGQLLAVLENRELASEVHDLQLSIEISASKCRVHERKGRLAALQAEREQLVALDTRLAEKQRQLEQLTVYAKSGGQIIGRKLDDLIGMYVQEGDELMSIGSDGEKELQISVGQDDYDAFASRLQSNVRVRLTGSGSFTGTLVELTPRATRQVSHPALAGSSGGPLPVRAVDDSQGGGSSEQFELLAPRFAGKLRLATATSRQLRSGQVATVSFRDYDESIGGHCLRCMSKWIRAALHQHGKKQHSSGAA